MRKPNRSGFLEEIEKILLLSRISLIFSSKVAVSLTCPLKTDPIIILGS
jgi:hypothetical protein